jgi:DNA-binding IscR family transcriptional regulator
MFARSSGYAVKALTHLAGQPSGKLVGAREMATTLHIPMPFLWKILRKLGKKEAGSVVQGSARRLSTSAACRNDLCVAKF